MAGLLSDLSLGSSALLAQQAGVDVTGRNTANVNTPGYQRENVDLASQLGSPLVGGVTANSVSRASDDLLSIRERAQASTSGSAQTLSASLNDLQNSLTPANNDLVQSIGGLFSSLGALQASPSDSALRTQVIQSAQALASSFNDASAVVSASIKNAESQMVPLAGSATGLAAQIAQANAALATSADPVLQDQRDLAAQKLASLTGAQARIDPDGQMRVSLPGGAMLVDGKRSATVTTSYSPTTGKMIVQTVVGNTKTDVTDQLDGQLGGLVSFRDGTAAQAQTQIDQLAYDLSSQLNAVHAAGVGLDGSTGNNLFTAPPAAVVGSAAGFAVDPNVLADPDKLASRTAGGGAGDDSGVSALLALRDQPLAAGGKRSFTDEAIHALGSVGSAAKSASDNLTLQNAKSETLASARDSVSGVSQQDELARLAQFQHAAEAASQYISVVNQLLDNLLQNL
jgi:flagellar hook-associated protein 1 FlgK